MSTVRRNSKRRKQTQRARSSHKSPFPHLIFDFPPEIRNRIYTATFDFIPKVIEIQLPLLDRERRCKPPPLIQVCSQIRKEAGSLYYSEQWFKGHLEMHSHEPFMWLMSWLQSLGPENRTMLRYLYLTTPLVTGDSITSDDYLDDLHALLENRGVGIPTSALWVGVTPMCYILEGDGSSREEHWIHRDMGSEEAMLTTRSVDVEDLPSDDGVYNFCRLKPPSRFANR